MPTTSPGVGSSPPLSPLRHPRGRRWRRAAWAFLLILALAILLRGWWLPLALRPLLSQQVEELLQWNLHYDSLETDGWSYLEMREVHLQPKATEVLRRTTMARIRVEFNLLDLWKHGLEGVSNLALQDLELQTWLEHEVPQPESEETPLTLSWLPEIWNQLPPLSLEGLSWNDQGQEILQLDEIRFLTSSTPLTPHRFQIDGELLRLSADLQLESDQLLVALDLDHLQWDPKWQHLMTEPIAEDLQTSTVARVHFRLPLTDPMALGVAIENLDWVGTQSAAQWEVHGSSSGELPADWTAAGMLQTWNGDLSFRTDDWPSFQAAWNLPPETPSALGEVQSIGVQLHYADGTFALSEATLGTSRGSMEASQSRFTLTASEGNWMVGIPHLQINSLTEQDYPLSDGRVLPAGSGRWVLETLEDLPLGQGMPPLKLLLHEFAWESSDGQLWLRQQEPMRLEYSSQALVIPRWLLQTPAGSLELIAQLPLSMDGDTAQELRPWFASLTSDGFSLASLQSIPGVPILPIHDGTMHGTIQLQGSQAAPELQGDWAFRQLQVSSDSFPDGFPENIDLDLSFVWDDAGLAMNHVHYQDEAATLEANGFLELPILTLQDPDRLRQPWSTLPFRMEGHAQASDRSWIADLLAPASPLRGGQLQLDMTAQGILGDPEAQAQVTADAWTPQEALAGKLPSGPLALKLTGDLKDGNLAIHSTWDIGARQLATIQGEIRQVLSGAQDFSLRLESASLQPDWLGWQGTANLQADVHGVGEDWVMDAQFEGVQLEPLITSEDNAMPPFDLTGTVRWDQESLRVVDFRAEGASIQAQAIASWALPFQPDAWTDLSPMEVPLQASLNGEFDTIEWLATIPSLRRAEGQLEFQAKVEGSLGDPKWQGHLDFQNAAFRLADPGLPSVEALELHAVWDHEGLKFHDSRGELGAAPFTLAGGMQLQADGSLLSDMTLHGSDLLLYRTSGVKIRADSTLTIQGSWPQLTIGGNLVFKDSRIVQNIPLLQSPIGPPRPPSPSGLTLFRLTPPLDQLIFALDLRAEPGILLRSNVARGRMRPQLRLEGTGAVPILRGEIFLDEVSMALPATRLYLQPSVARFLEDDPFHPRLELLGRSSLYGYEVQVVVTGPYDQPQVLLSSSPPLAESEILVLLTTGQPPANRLDRRAAAGTVALYLARDFITTFFGSDSVDAEESLLDRLEINFGRDQTRSGVETLNGRLRLRDDVLLEGDNLYLEGGRDAFEDFFLGLELLLRFP